MLKRRFSGLTPVFLFVSLLVVACGRAEPTPDQPPGGMMNMAPPADLNTATTRTTDDGHFQITITSQLDPMVINQIHSWIVHVETPDGRPVDGATVTIDGGMPQHMHGFPTAPEVTEALGRGDYRVEGVRFNMGGWWEFKVIVEAGGQTDSVTFNIVL
jgi:hypothetical protein